MRNDTLRVHLTYGGLDPHLIATVLSKAVLESRLMDLYLLIGMPCSFDDRSVSVFRNGLLIPKVETVCKR